MLGAKDYSKSKVISSFSIYSSLILGIIVAALAFHLQIKSRKCWEQVERLYTLRVLFESDVFEFASCHIILCVRTIC